MDKGKDLSKAETSLTLFSLMCVLSIPASPRSYQDHPFPKIFSLNRQGNKKKYSLLWSVNWEREQTPGLTYLIVKRDDYRDHN